jgi:hypothetical protein
MRYDTLADYHESRMRYTEALLRYTDRHSADEQLIRRLLAPPDLDDSVEALEFWRGRRRRLAWYRLRARREAAQMIVLCERRIGKAVATQLRVPVGRRVAAGVLVAQTRVERWTRTARTVVIATASIVLVMAAIPIIAFAVLLAHVL